MAAVARHPARPNSGLCGRHRRLGAGSDRPRPRTDVLSPTRLGSRRSGHGRSPARPSECASAQRPSCATVAVADGGALRHCLASAQCCQWLLATSSLRVSETRPGTVIWSRTALHARHSGVILMSRRKFLVNFQECMPHDACFEFSVRCCRLCTQLGGVKWHLTFNLPCSSFWSSCDFKFRAPPELSIEVTSPKSTGSRMP